MKSFSVETIDVDVALLEQTVNELVTLKINPKEPRPGYLDPCEMKIVEAYRAEPTSMNATLTPVEQLQLVRDSMGFPNRNLNTIEIHTKFEEVYLEDRVIGLWRYFPRKTARQGDAPCLIYFHGGGFIGGSVYTLENPCKLIAELADAVVFNIDYSLAPEHPFPAGFDDAYYVVHHIAKNAKQYGIDPKKIAVAGDSAGGNLAAAVSIKDRDEKRHQIAMQMLIYPVVQLSGESVNGYQWDLASYTMAKEEEAIIEPMLSLGRPRPNDEIEQTGMHDLYFPDQTMANSPYASPILADASGLPKALIVTAEFDGLRLQGEFYARKLAQAGVSVRALRYKGSTHAFFDKLGAVPQAKDLCEEISRALLSL